MHTLDIHKFLSVAYLVLSQMDPSPEKDFQDGIPAEFPKEQAQNQLLSICLRKYQVNCLKNELKLMRHLNNKELEDRCV